MNGLNPATSTFGTEGDISNICQFDWYEWCYFREESHVLFPFQKRQLGRVLAPLKNEGNEMYQAVLTITDKVVPRRTVSKLTTAEINSNVEIRKMQRFDEEIHKHLGSSTKIESTFPIPSPDDDLLSE